MKISRAVRLNQIENILWSNDSPLTVKQITKILKLKSQSYVSSLLQQLESQGKVNRQLSMFDKRIKEYRPVINNSGLLPTDLPLLLCINH